ncbi:SigE family RNA polymerase sigma factor [Longispora sp. K20-0274]|uniref:SigE family RNA polymerase sigma factor n=1 Tax=Longispora sp. K20-0274 TaxID=3088255 RepID=UPI00399995AD
MDGHAGFEEFVVGRSARLVRLAYGLTQDHGLAEDLVQTALAKSWSAWRRIVDDPEPYVRRVIVNTYNSWWRRAWHRERPAEVLPELTMAGPQRAVDDRDAVWRALRVLPRQQRAVLVLRYLEDLSEEQTAEALSLSPGTVKSYSAKGLAKLRLDAGLRELRAPAAPGGDDAERLVAVRTRIERRRRGRLAVAGAAVAVVLALLLAYVVAPATRESLPPAPPRPVPTTVSVPPLPEKVADLPGLPDFEEGYRVITGAPRAKMPMTGAAPVEFAWTPSTLDVRLYTLCPVILEHPLWFMVAMNGLNVGTVGCGGDPHPRAQRERPLDADLLKAAGVTIGRPTTVRISEGQVTAILPVPVGGQPKPPADPGTLTIGLAEAVAFERFPLPARPDPLKVLPAPSGVGPVLRPGTLSATVVWGPELWLSGYSQTPGILDILVDGHPLPRVMTWWDYDGYYIGLATGANSVTPYPNPPAGSTVTISVNPRFVTGDWYVAIGEKRR